jgi:succinate-semialdehyde dehydrogenase/glutarate-semialdehyde dehydrogenase
MLKEIFKFLISKKAFISFEEFTSIRSISEENEKRITIFSVLTNHRPSDLSTSVESFFLSEKLIPPAVKFIVFDDADMDSAVEGAMISKFRNAGQTCVCANRIYVQDGIYDAFIEKFAAKVATLKVGNGFSEGVSQGPLIEDAAVDKVERHVADAVKQGGRVLAGGKKLQGQFFEPTVIADAKASMLCAKEETFGPFAPVFRFSTEQEAIDAANNTEFGLASYFYTRDVGRIYRVAEALEYGMVGINVGVIATEHVPFGGMKQSGLGREGSSHGMAEYLEMKYLCMGDILQK